MVTKAILLLLFSLLLISTRVSSIKEKFETPKHYLAPSPAPEWVHLPPKKAPACPPKPPTTVYPPPKPPVKPPVHPPVKPPPAPTPKPPTPAPKPPVYPPVKPPVHPPVKPPPAPAPEPPTPAPKPPVYPPPQKSPPMPPVFYGCSHKCVYYCKSKRPRPPLRACQRACSLCCKQHQCIPGISAKCDQWNYVKDKLGYQIKCP